MSTMEDDGVTLVIDDADALAELLCRRLKALGVSHVRKAITLKQAKEIVEENKVNHVISDWKVPVDGGVEFLLNMRRRDPKVRLTLLTGYEPELGENTRKKLRESSVRVEMKGNVDTEQLREMASLLPATKERPQRTHSKPDFSSLNEIDKFAARQLQIDELNDNLDDRDNVIRKLTEDLVEELMETEQRFKTGDAVLPGGGVNIGGILSDVQNLTPRGLRLIDLDRSARRRIRKRRKIGSKRV